MQKNTLYTNRLLLGMLLFAFAIQLCLKTASAQNNQQDSLRVIRLYKENGKPVSDYNQQIANILEANKQKKLPIIVQLSQGLTVTVYAVGHGNQNLIFDIGENRVLRIRINLYRPLYFWKALTDPYAMIDSLDLYLRGHKELRREGIPVPELLVVPGRQREFLVLEKLNLEFLYADYLDPVFMSKIPAHEVEKIDRDFLEFAAKTAQFRNFGDFGGKQLGYTKNRGWVLFDFSNNHDRETSIGGNVFEYDRYDEAVNKQAQYNPTPAEIVNKPGLPQHLRYKVTELIESVRQGKIKITLECKLLFN